MRNARVRTARLSVRVGWIFGFVGEGVFRLPQLAQEKCCRPSGRGLGRIWFCQQTTKIGPLRRETRAGGRLLSPGRFSNAGAWSLRQPTHCFSVSSESTQIRSVAIFRQRVHTSALWQETADHSVLQVEWIGFYGDRGQTPNSLRFVRHSQFRRGR
jgi:hypothetical protein